MILIKSYIINKTTTINKNILKYYVKHFWNDVFQPLHNNNNNMHLLLMCKVEFQESTMGYRTLADLRKVNFTDVDYFIDYLADRLGILSEAYKVTPFSKIVFSYVIKDGVAEDNRLLLNEPKYEVTTYKFNNMVLPLTMDPQKYGIQIAEQFFNEENKSRYVVRNEANIFTIDVTQNGLVNNVQLCGPADLKWVDTKISEDSFQRELGKNIFYIKDGVVTVKGKQLNAKPFRKVNLDNKLASVDNIMTIDIETVDIGGK